MKKKNFITIKETVIDKLMENKAICKINSRKIHEEEKNIYYDVGNAVVYQKVKKEVH